MFGDWLKQRRELNELLEYEAESVSWSSIPGTRMQSTR
jgi:hypothetical protein